MDSAPFNVMSLCSGIGGLDLGLRLAVPSARTVCMVEREAFCIGILVKQMEEGNLDPCPIWTDLTRLDGKAWRGTVDCIIGGYPCQPFSVAGKQRGTADPRHLFPRIARLVEEVRPSLVFFENVDNHLTIGFEEVGERLQEMGFRVAAGTFSAAEVGASHQRKRLFIMAHREGNGRLVRGSKSARIEGRPDAAERSGSVAYTGLSGLEGWEKQPAREECATTERGSLFPPGQDEWDRWKNVPRELLPAVERPVRGVAHGNAGRVDRLRALGNGVVPVVAAFAFRTLAKDLGLA